MSDEGKVKICVVGLGYVGLPLACLLSKKFPVIGFDINEKRIKDLRSGIDTTGEVENLSAYKMSFTHDEKEIQNANFVIAAIPTPVDEDNKPDLRLLEAACKTIGRNLSRNSIVVFESTVYPSCTEEFCVPIIESASGKKYMQDFKVGYSPERVNPGDKYHTIDKITKIVSGCDAESLETISHVYGSITTIHKASSIKVAEAAKVIENVQRDLNIALMNELAIIFSKMGIDTREVIDAAATKWNFHRYTPGLVGGHCIGVDPYYLTHKAKELGYESKVILSGRDINNFMADFVAQFVAESSKKKAGLKALVYGLTFKENVPDTRNSKAFELIAKLKHYGFDVFAMDPFLDEGRILQEFGVRRVSQHTSEIFDAIIIVSPHKELDKISLQDWENKLTLEGVFFDVKGFYDKKKAQEIGIVYHRL